MQIVINDRASYQITSREITPDGFLRVPGYVAKQGIQQYTAKELNLPGDPNRKVNVYRPPEEVFHPDSLASYEGVDVTINHPPVLVNADNFKKYSVGNVIGKGEREGDFVKCVLLIKDAKAISDIEKGKSELSNGYRATYDYAPGVTHDGAEYEYIQSGIGINHVAVVDKARAGHQARIFDNEGVATMPVLVTLDSGRAIDVADPNNAQVVADAFDRLTKTVNDSAAALKAANESNEKLQATFDAMKEEHEKLKQITTSDALSERVKLIAKTKNDALKIAGEKFVCDSVDTLEIQRAALEIIRPGVQWKDKTEVYIQAAFDAALEVADSAENKSTVIEKQRQQIATDGASQPSQEDKPVMSRAQIALLKSTGKYKEGDK